MNDSTLLVFGKLSEDRLSLLTIDTSGHVLSQVLDDDILLPYSDTDATVSPDASKVAITINYEKDEQFSAKVLMLNLIDLSVIDLTHETLLPYSAKKPDWSPDSQQFIISSNLASNFDFLLPDTNTLKHVDLSALEIIYPNWSPTSQYISFGANRGDAKAYMVNRDGTQVRNLQRAALNKPNCPSDMKIEQFDLMYPPFMDIWSPAGKHVFIPGGMFGCISGFSIIGTDEIETIPTEIVQ